MSDQYESTPTTNQPSSKYSSAKDEDTDGAELIGSEKLNNKADFERDSALNSDKTKKAESDNSSESSLAQQQPEFSSLTANIDHTNNSEDSAADEPNSDLTRDIAGKTACRISTQETTNSSSSTPSKMPSSLAAAAGAQAASTLALAAAAGIRRQEKNTKPPEDPMAHLSQGNHNLEEINPMYEGLVHENHESASPYGHQIDPSQEGASVESPVKLFVGQVPKNMTEDDLLPILGNPEYGGGPIKELTIIRDKHTGQHRGCAFVTFWNASDAVRIQETLHDQFTLPGGRKPIQIKSAHPSGGGGGAVAILEVPGGQMMLSPGVVPGLGAPAYVSPEQENKLFVGMTSRNADESAIRELFAPFGEIREIYIIRNADGSNKGCAFLKFQHRESALSAIEVLNDKIVMEGATRPLIVKFADTKAQRRARTGVGPGRIGMPPTGHPNPYYMPHSNPAMLYQHYQQHGHQVPIPVPSALGGQYQQGAYSQYPAAAGTPPHGYMYQHMQAPPPSPYGYPTAYGSTSSHGSDSPIPGDTTPPQQTLPNVGHTQTASSLQSRQQAPVLQAYAASNQRQDGTIVIPAAANAGGGMAPRPREGPSGANLFIYHLPHDLTDADLATAFNPFGNVISAKVYVDKFTGESKGFGFVSYDSTMAAEAAIEQMNGFQIGSKRLKVQHKRVNSNGMQKFHNPPLNNAGHGMMHTMTVPVHTSTQEGDVMVGVDPSSLGGQEGNQASLSVEGIGSGVKTGPSQSQEEEIAGELEHLDLSYRG